MKSLNESTLIGHLTGDPELKETKNGNKCCTFSIATNREWKDKDGNKQSVADFHNIVVWGKLAEICGQYLKKGRPIWCRGAMITRSWEDEGSGKKMYRTEIHLNEMNMLNAGSGGRGRGPDEEPEGIGYSGASDDDNGAKNPHHFDDDEVSIEDVPF